MLRLDGILLIDKPIGMTSHDVVDHLRRATGTRKIGHTGTLDPLATGLLVLCLGKATKLSQFLTGVNKKYSAEVTLGVKSATYDAEGIDESTRKNVPNLSNDKIITALDTFQGTIMQQVPIFSAVKVGGKKLYELARKNKEVKTPSREVNIEKIELIDYSEPKLKFEVTCSKGTYIRSLANDLGDLLGCGAYLSNLRRSSNGSLSVNDALSLKDACLLAEGQKLNERLIGLEDVLEYPLIRVKEEFSRHIIEGRAPRFNNVMEISSEFGIDEIISLTDPRGTIMAVGKSLIGSSEMINLPENEFFKYIRVLN